MAFTKEQQKAIDLEGTNIIVSAGAGSGKTAVLTERVKRKILDGVHVNQLLVLTFTNAAAAEMKDRIRKVIIKNPELHGELDLIDGAYITTFDSFSLSIVKKYHTRLNITNNPSITEEVVVNLKKKEILDEIFDEMYLSPSKEFLKLINDFCLKDDKKLKSLILNCYRKIELKYDKSYFLENYFNIFNKEKIEEFILEYMDIIKEKRNIVVDLIEELYDYFDDSFVLKIKDELNKFINADSYDDFINSMEYKLPNAPKGSDEVGKKIKEAISKEIKDIKDNYLIYSCIDEVREDIYSTLDNTKVIIDILIKLDERLDKYKLENELFSFNDIARLAIKVVEENKDIQEELRESFNEIMIDEYQDTSDTQEKFISLISKNNVYMVGDIKQSIYRFRNANPSIFKNKYELYKNSDCGEAIDLLNNFRSREEVLSDINLLFDYVMDSKIGGAEYQESHRMVFGKENYNTDGKTDYDNHLKILTYDKSNLGYTSIALQEAFIIAKDIKNKIDNKYLVFDKGTEKLRECRYSDFVILLDRGTNFNLYKNVFEYFKLPLTILKEERFKKDDDAYIFKNLLKLIININKNNFDNEFKYSFVSLSRSYLYRIDDDLIYSYILNGNYKDSLLYKDLEDISREIDYLTPLEIVRKILDKINYDLKLLNINNIRANRVRCEYFYNLIKSYESTGKTIYDFVDYLDSIFDNEDQDLKFNISSLSNNSCMIMTIHKSKGLEYPVCYFAGFSSDFNFRDVYDKIIFDNQYGLILSKVDNYYKDTILKILLKKRNRIDEVSEKIRLLYVAVTRVREKMIIVMPKIEEDREIRDILPLYVREGYKSFLDIMKSIYSNLVDYVEEYSEIADRNILVSKGKDKLISNCCDVINVKSLNIETNEVVSKHYSKDDMHIVTKEEKDRLEFGTKVHEILELIDFNDKESINNISDNYVKDRILKFLNSDLMKNRLSNKMYKEYEFIYKEDYIINHGIIDLLIEDKDQYIIVDYKLKNIDDSNYDKQLNGYRHYIEDKTHKKTLCYLYSIIDGEYREINYND